MEIIFMALLLTGFHVLSATAQLPAFPGAEGFGRYAYGGRGGDAYYVTKLDYSGPGSLRYGIESADGPRTILFGIPGTIFLESNLVINEPNITIAGQTAPGDGITRANAGLYVAAVHIIVRYIRDRMGDTAAGRLLPQTGYLHPR